MENKLTNLHSISHEPILAEDDCPFFKTYLSDESRNLEREGLFHTLLNRLHGPKSGLIPHFLLTQFEAFNDQEVFYRIRPKNLIKPGEAKEIILIFNLNPELNSLEILSDFFNWFKRQKCRSLIKAFYHFDVDIKNPSHQLYISQFFKIIATELGEVPETLTLLQLEKQASFEGVLVLEAGALWKCLDNYLVHLILSKGGSCNLVETEKEFELVSSKELSPYHSLQILKRLNHGLAICPHLKEAASLNLFKNPQDLKLFTFLIYKNFLKNE